MTRTLKPWAVLLGTFEELHFNFLLVVFSAIFSHSNSLTHIAQSKISNILYCTSNWHPFRKKSYPSWEGILKMTPSFQLVKRNRMEPIEGENKSWPTGEYLWKLLMWRLWIFQADFVMYHDLNFSAFITPEIFRTTSMFHSLYRNKHFTYPITYDYLTNVDGSGVILIIKLYWHNSWIFYVHHLNQWRTEGVGGFNPPEISKFWQSWVEFPVPWKIHPQQPNQNMGFTNL
jgi:hypothetical protein